MFSGAVKYLKFPPSFASISQTYVKLSLGLLSSIDIVSVNDYIVVLSVQLSLFEQSVNNILDLSIGISFLYAKCQRCNFSSKMAYMIYNCTLRLPHLHIHNSINHRSGCELQISTKVRGGLSHSRHYNFPCIQILSSAIQT